DGHRSCRETGGKLGSVVGAVSRGGSNDVADGNRTREGSNKTRIAIIAGDDARLPKVNLPLPIGARGVAGGIAEELEQERAVGPAIECAAHAGPVSTDCLRQHRIVLEHVIAAGRIAGYVWINVLGFDVNAQSAVREDGIAKNGVVGAAATNAHACEKPLAEGNAVAGAGSGAADHVIARVGALHAMSRIAQSRYPVDLGPDQIALNHIPRGVG